MIQVFSEFLLIAKDSKQFSRDFYRVYSCLYRMLFRVFKGAFGFHNEIVSTFFRNKQKTQTKNVDEFMILFSETMSLSDSRTYP